MENSSNNKEYSSHSKEHSSHTSINITKQHSIFIDKNENENFLPPTYLSVCGIDCEMCYTELGLELTRVSTDRTCIAINMVIFFCYPNQLHRFCTSPGAIFLFIFIFSFILSFFVLYLIVFVRLINIAKHIYLFPLLGDCSVSSERSSV